MIKESEPAPTRALTDGDDRLLRADEPLASVQRGCGGTIPGAIAIPALAELVRTARRFGLHMARPIAMQDGQNAIRAWVHIEPHDDSISGSEHRSADWQRGGCVIVMRHWHTAPLARKDPDIGLNRGTEIDRALADMVARLDNQQCLLSVEGKAPDLLELMTLMRSGLGRPWTDFVTIKGNHHPLPMDWELSDGCSIEIAGSPRTWRISLVPQTGPDNSPTGFQLSMTAETPLAQNAFSNDPQEYALGGKPLKGMFERVLAPALRQPIGRIIANAQTVRMRMAGPLLPEYAGFAADMVAAGEHLLALVDDLADLEVIEADEFTTIPDVIDLADVVRRAAGMLSGRARSKQIVIVEPQEGTILLARADLRRVLQVLLNLIGNALDYAAKQTQIRLELALVAGQAQVTVADEGPGLSVDEQSRLFHKFQRLGRSGDGGSGLGLYISRRLARAMGGELTVASALGEGARFTLSVPGVDAQHSGEG